jgi:hypothetical protein
MNQAGSLRELEMLWQTRLEQAARRHGMATVQYLRVVDEYDQPALSSDGQVAILRAIREADAARAEHMRVLRIFTDLKTGGRLPEKSDRRPV